MSDTSNPGAASRLDDDRKAVGDAARHEAESARAEAGKAGDTIRQEAAGLASSARQKAFEGAEQGKAAAASSLSDFTAAIRKASEELGERDQSMAAGLARQAASGLEQAADAINGRSVQDLTRSVADFARRQPGAFLIGAALAGVALGRFARASGDHAGPLGPDRSRDDRYDDDWRRETLVGRGSAAGSRASSGSRPFDAAGERHGPGLSGAAGTSGANAAATSSQADATGFGASTTAAPLNRPGASGSTNTAGLSGTPSSTSTGERP